MRNLILLAWIIFGFTCCAGRNHDELGLIVIGNDCLSDKNKVKVYLSLKELIMKMGSKESNGEGVLTTFNYDEVQLTYGLTSNKSQKQPNNNLEYILISDGEMRYALNCDMVEGKNIVRVGTIIYSDIVENQKKYEDHFCQNLPLIIKGINKGHAK